MLNIDIRNLTNEKYNETIKLFKVHMIDDGKENIVVYQSCEFNASLKNITDKVVLLCEAHLLSTISRVSKCKRCII